MKNLIQEAGMSIESAVKVVLSAPCIKDKANNVSEEKIEEETVSKPIERNLDINKCSKYNLQYSSCMRKSIRHNMDKDKKK